MDEATGQVEVMRLYGWIRVINRSSQEAVIPCAWPPGAVDVVQPGRWLLRREHGPGPYFVGPVDALFSVRVLPG
jgi:hypothetical protein